MIRFAPGRIEDAEHVLANLRPQEVKTIAKLGLDPLAEIGRVIDSSFTCFVDDEPVAMFGGAQETILGNCRLWMLTTPGIERHQVPLLRWSKRFVEWMSHTYCGVIGMVDIDNKTSYRWLRWIGFQEISNDGSYIMMRYS